MNFYCQHFHLKSPETITNNLYLNLNKKKNVLNCIHEKKSKKLKLKYYYFFFHLSGVFKIVVYINMDKKS